MAKKSVLPSIPAHPLPAPIPPGFVQLTNAAPAMPILLPARALVVVGPVKDTGLVTIYLVGGECRFTVSESYADVLALVNAAVRT